MTGLEGARVLIVEDDWLQANDLAMQFSDLGAEVIGPAGDIKAGLELAPSADMAILDVNVCGEFVFPIADNLHSRGAPIVFYSAYTSIPIPPRFHFASRLSKPSPASRVQQVAQRALDDVRDEPDDVALVLPKLRLIARLLVEEHNASDRLVEVALLRAIATNRPQGENLEGWLTRLLVETADQRGKRLLT